LVSYIRAIRETFRDPVPTGTGGRPWGVLTLGLGSLSQHGHRLWFRHD
jgi:hypothetical protein